MSPEIQYRPDLVRWIVRRASTHGYKLTPTRIVKFLYLADLYHFRTAKETLTKWPWKFWDYGPFCGETLRSIEQAVQEGWVQSESRSSSYQEGNEYILFWPHTSDEDRDFVPQDLQPSVRGHLEDAIQKWGAATHDLLDFVYFYTEPMVCAQPREDLDFRSVHTWEDLQPRESRKLDKATIKKARAIMARIPKVPEQVKPIWFDMGAAQTTGGPQEGSVEPSANVGLRIDPATYR